MKKDKILVVVFPEKVYFGYDRQAIKAYNYCLRKRYLDKGYQLRTVDYQKPDSLITVPTQRSVSAGLTLDAATDQDGQNYQTPDFARIASALELQAAGQITVCGFHCFDCVEKLAQQIYAINRKVIIDTDLTDLFIPRCLEKDFVPEKFNPDAKLKNYRDHPLNQAFKERVKKRYFNPIWGLSKAGREALEKDF